MLPPLLVDERETALIQQERVSVCRLFVRRLRPRLALTTSDDARTALSHNGFSTPQDTQSDAYWLFATQHTDLPAGRATLPRLRQHECPRAGRGVVA